MVCCQSYWARQEIDAAGKVGSSLQKILFVLCALTAATFLSCEPLTIMGGGAALLVYAVGIHGAQKRAHRALFFYASVSLLSLVLSAIAAAFLGGFLLFGGGAQPIDGQLMLGGAMQQAGIVEQVPVLTETTAQTPDGKYFELVQISNDPDLLELEFPNKPKTPDVTVDANNKPKVQPAEPAKPSKHHGSRNDDDDDEHAKSSKNNNKPVKLVFPNGNKKSDGGAFDGNDDDVEVRVTPFGWAVLSIALVLALFMLVLKIKSIRLAFQMRRMLLAMQQPTLPTRGVQLSTPVVNVQPPAGPAPTVRRDCARCTYVNAADASRCSMCDAPLPSVAGAAPAPVPKVYVPSALYPLNAPMN